MTDFVLQLLQFAILPFSWTDNIIVFVPTFCLFWCAGWAVVRSLFRHFKRW